MDMHLHITAEGMVIRQLHSDRAAEFRSRRLQRCKERDIMQTWTAGDEPQSHGRAEKAIQDVKRQAHTILCAADVWRRNGGQLRHDTSTNHGEARDSA